MPRQHNRNSALRAFDRQIINHIEQLFKLKVDMFDERLHRWRVFLLVLLSVGWSSVENRQNILASPFLCPVCAVEDRIKNDSHVLIEASH